MWESLFSLISSLLIIVAILFLAYLFTKYVAGRLYSGQSSYRSKRMKVLETINTGKDQKLMLVQMGENIYFLGLSQGNVTCIERVSQEQAKKWTQEDNEKYSQLPETSFSDTLKKVAEQFNNKRRP